MNGALIHVLIIMVMGWGIRRLLPSRTEGFDTPQGIFRGPDFWAEAFMAGFFAETTLAFLLLFAGAGLGFCAVAMPVAAALAAACSVLAKPFRPSWLATDITWYELLLWLVLAFQFTAGLYGLLETPLIFDDAITAWAGRARALYGGVNWSFDPGSEHFLGRPGPMDYPLAKVVFYALGGVYNGGFDDVLVRFDTLVFHLCLAGVMWGGAGAAGGPRWVRTAAAFAVTAIPFTFTHALSGYGDILVQAYALAALAAVLKRENFLAGLFAAGMVFSKNDPLVLILPGLVLCFFTTWFSERKKLPDTPGPGGFILGLSLAAPWLLFLGLVVYGQAKAVWYFASLGGCAAVLALAYFLRAFAARLWEHRSVRLAAVAVAVAVSSSAVAAVALSQLHRIGLTVHPDAPLRLAKVMFLSQTHSIVWVFSAAALAASFGPMLRDPMGRGILVLAGCSILSLCGLFAFTGAYAWLVSETTVNRVLLQFYGLGLLGGFYGLGLVHERHAESVPASK